MNKNIKHIHFLGIGGVSQSALALILKSRGYEVSGSDAVESERTKKLEAYNIDICINSVSNKIKNADLVVFSAAIHEEDKEYKLAKSLGKKIISRAEMLGEIAKGYKNVISIAGSHGKTTTTGMIAQIFVQAGLDPTMHIGGDLISLKSNLRLGGNKYFITEACEYVDSFLKLKSDVSVILNIQKDHMDYFKTFKNLNRSFLKFANRTKEGGLVVFCGDDENAHKDYNQASICYSAFGKGIVNARNIKEYEKGKYKFDCYFLGTRLMKVKLGVYGFHNVSNALASISVALWYNIDIDIIKKALFEYKGVKRRFEDYGEVNGVRVIHDYAHHPTEIKATINLAKRICEGDLYVVFQPHTYSRTLALIEDFKTCFYGAKEALIYKVYPAREAPEEGIGEKELARKISMHGQKAFSFESYGEMKEYLLGKLKPKDMLLVLGAGDIESFTNFFICNNT